MFTAIMEDEQIILRQVAEGNEAAFRKLILEYADLVHFFLLKHLKQPEAAEEIVQDIFLQIWQTRETLTEIRRFKPFLYVLAKHYALNEIKRLVRQRKHEQEWGNRMPETDMPADDQRVTILEAAIRQLPPQQQKAWILSRKEGYRQSEVAEIMGISKETVKKYIQYATAAISKYVTHHLTSAIIFLFIKKI